VSTQKVHPLSVRTKCIWSVVCCRGPSSNHNHLHVQKARSRPVSAHGMSWFKVCVLKGG
jgi:hypothetical protein